jgi:hypothetical protein
VIRQVGRGPAKYRGTREHDKGQACQMLNAAETPFSDPENLHLILRTLLATYQSAPALRPFADRLRLLPSCFVLE